MCNDTVLNDLSLRYNAAMSGLYGLPTFNGYPGDTFESRDKDEVLTMIAMTEKAKTELNDIIFKTSGELSMLKSLVSKLETLLKDANEDSKTVARYRQMAIKCASDLVG